VEEVSDLVKEDNVEAIREDQFLEEVYGAQSRLDNEAWVKVVASKKANWIFNAKDFRVKLFAQAGVTKRH
jgi:hypothetical protein